MLFSVPGDVGAGVACQHLDRDLRTRHNQLGAYVPALPGLGVVGETRAEAEQLIREGIPFHLEGLAEDGLPIPDPTSIEVDAIAI